MGKCTFKCLFQHRLPVDLQLFLCGFQFRHAGVQFGKQLLDFGDNALLFRYIRCWNKHPFHGSLCQFIPCRSSNQTVVIYLVQIITQKLIIKP